MKKAILSICLTLASVSLFAQGFKVEIKQVFPKKVIVYSNTFRFKREMESAVSSQSAKYRGNGNNYSVLIETPTGKETRQIQNIVWIESVNGVKTYHKKQTSPSSSYKSATNWQGYACTVDGSPKGTVKKEDFVYRVSLIGSTNEYETAFISLTNAKTEANKIFAETNSNKSLVEVVIYKFVDKEKTKIDILTNKKEYLAYKEKLQREDSLEVVKSNNLSIKNAIEKFKTEMIFINSKKDSLMKDEGIKHCRLALEEAAKIIPDSIFISEKLDSTYKSILIIDFLSNNKNKEIKGLLNELQTRDNSNDSLEVKAILLDYTKRIESILFPSATKVQVIEDAYKKVVPIGVEPYQFEIEGVKFSFYEKKPNEGILVNEKTKEYEVGTFEPVRGADNKFIYQAKKVKKYSRDGKKI